jgi:hypothetical protein
LHQSFHRLRSGVNHSLHRSWSGVVVHFARGDAVYPSFHRLRSAVYQLFHRSRSGVVSVILSLAVGRDISPSIARGRACTSRSIACGRAVYPSLHRPWSGVVSFVPSLAVGHGTSRFIACNWLFQRPRSGAVSAASPRPFNPSLAVSLCVSCSLACRQLLYSSFLASSQSLFLRPVAQARGFISCSIKVAHGQSLYQSFHRVSSVVVNLQQSFHSLRTIACGLSKAHSQ